MKRIVIIAAAVWAAAGITACTAKGMGYTKASLETVESAQSTGQTAQDSAGEPSAEPSDPVGDQEKEISPGE